MTTTNSNTKYRLLVLMDLSKASQIVLENAVQLAKVIEGSVEVLHVKSPTDVVRHENQFSAIRTIHEDYHLSKSRLKRIVRKIEKESRIPIRYQMAYGNIKNAIMDHISMIKPDIILLGKRKATVANFFRHGITKFLLKYCTANLLILGEDQRFHSYADVSLGIYGEVLLQNGFKIMNDLKRKNASTIQLFSISNRKDSQKDVIHHQSGKKMISYVFSESASAFDNLASYVSKTNTQLFCIPRKSSNIRMLQKFNIPVLVLR